MKLQNMSGRMEFAGGPVLVGTGKLVGLFLWTGTRLDYFTCELYTLCLLYLKNKRDLDQKHKIRV